MSIYSFTRVKIYTKDSKADYGVRHKILDLRVAHIFLGGEMISRVRLAQGPRVRRSGTSITTEIQETLD